MWGLRVGQLNNAFPKNGHISLALSGHGGLVSQNQSLENTVLGRGNSKCKWQMAGETRVSLTNWRVGSGDRDRKARGRWGRVNSGGGRICNHSEDSEDHPKAWEGTGFGRPTEAELWRVLEEERARGREWTRRQCCLNKRKDGAWELRAEVTGRRERSWQRTLANKIVRTWTLIRWDC